MTTSTPAERIPHIVIRPRGRFHAVDVREVWAFRDLLRSIAGRDIRLRYRQTALGVIWVVLQPLLAAGVFTFVFGRVAKLGSDGVPYIVFAYSGLLGWNAFSGVLSRSSSSVVGGGGMLSKIYFPRLLLPLSTVGSALLDFSVALCLQVVLLVVYGINPGWHVLLLPVWLALMLVLALGVGLITSALTVRYRDVSYVIPILTQLLLFATPIAYPLSAVPHSVRWVVGINPLAGPMQAFHWSLLGRGTLPFGYLLYSVGIAGVLLVFGAFVFSSLERTFADVI